MTKRSTQKSQCCKRQFVYMRLDYSPTKAELIICLLLIELNPRANLSFPVLTEPIHETFFTY